MSPTTRRSFLSLLAHVPLLGVWIVPKQTTKNFADVIRAQLVADHELAAAVEEERFQADREQAEYDRMHRVIRWIPVGQRLPECTEDWGGIHVSRGVLTTDGAGCVWFGRVVDRGLGKPYWFVIHPNYQDGSASQEVTHWAELPQPPQISGPQSPE